VNKFGETLEKIKVKVDSRNKEKDVSEILYRVNQKIDDRYYRLQGEGRKIIIKGNVGKLGKFLK